MKRFALIERKNEGLVVCYYSTLHYCSLSSSLHFYLFVNLMAITTRKSMITITFVIYGMQFWNNSQGSILCNSVSQAKQNKDRQIRFILTWSEESAVVRVLVGFLCCCCCCSSSLPPSPMRWSAFDAPKLSSSFCFPPSSSGFLRLKSAILLVCVRVGVCFVFTHSLLLERVYHCYVELVFRIYCIICLFVLAVSSHKFHEYTLMQSISDFFRGMHIGLVDRSLI